MSTDKYPCIFSRQMETIVYILLTSFCNKQQNDNVQETFGLYPWYHGSFAMVAKPIKTLQLHYPMIQLLIKIVFYKMLDIYLLTVQTAQS